MICLMTVRLGRIVISAGFTGILSLKMARISSLIMKIISTLPKSRKSAKPAPTFRWHYVGGHNRTPSEHERPAVRPMYWLIEPQI